ncbi:MAG TPA: pectin acetylesterase-family hydrolase [Ilumatobacter sp.]|nr:pectin acetylesterase-family hydrolase [Ilumatobacter sp.]
MRRRLLLLAAVALGVTVVSSYDAGSMTAATERSAAAVTAESPEWEQVVPGGDCQCSDGSEYSFWVRQADPTKVVFFMQGGGACWNAATCAPGSGYYKPITGPFDDPTSVGGIFDLANADNPLADYSFVFVPYCTGDVHLGDREHQYATDVTVQHKGFVNASAALDHLVETFPAAEEVLVTGESAGSVPSPLYGGLVADRMPAADVTVLGDGSGAYRRWPHITMMLADAWGWEATTPDWPETEKLKIKDWGAPAIFVNSAAHAPEVTFARHDYAYDDTQKFFADALGTNIDVLRSIDANEKWIEKKSGIELASYVAPGTNHTVLSSSDFYTEEVNGVALVDWVTALVSGEPVDDVHCTACE